MERGFLWVSFIMKFRCTCGHYIIDQTDDLPYAGYIYPDRSMGPLFHAIDQLWERKKPDDPLVSDRMTDPITNPKGGRVIYQCPECGNIWIKGDHGDLLGFSPMEKDTPKDLLKGE